MCFAPIADKPELRELWAIKETINRIYRIHGHGRAKLALTRLTDAMAHSQLPEVRTLRNTLVRWRARSSPTSSAASPTPAPRATMAKQSSSFGELTDTEASKTTASVS